MVIKQINYPVVSYYDLNSLIGGYFQGANKNDFSDAVNLYQITDRNKPNLYWNEIKFNKRFRFRYVRFCAKKRGYSDCNMSELKVENGNKALSGILISGKEHIADDKFSEKNVIDNDFTTCFLTKGRKANCWIGFDFGKPTDFNSIKFAAGMHEYGSSLYIVPGHKYELMYWNEDRWNSLGFQTAIDKQLSFSNAPQNTLFILHDRSSSVDERIFTVKNNQIMWF